MGRYTNPASFTFYLYSVCSGSAACRPVVCENAAPLDEDTLRRLLSDVRRGSVTAVDETGTQLKQPDARGLA